MERSEHDCDWEGEAQNKWAQRQAAAGQQGDMCARGDLWGFLYFHPALMIQAAACGGLWLSRLVRNRCGAVSLPDSPLFLLARG